MRIVGFGEHLRACGPTSHTVDKPPQGPKIRWLSSGFGPFEVVSQPNRIRAHGSGARHLHLHGAARKIFDIHLPTDRPRDFLCSPYACLVAGIEPPMAKASVTARFK